MIYFYSGTPGSGKSLSAAYKLIDTLNRKKNVIANFPINLSYFKKRKIGDFLYLDNQQLTPAALRSYAIQHHRAHREGQTLIIIDECAIMFNSRQWDRADRAQWILFFQEHRKLGFDILLIAQQDRMIDRQIRGFVESEYKHRAIKNYKNFGFILSWLTGGLFCRIEYWYGTSLKCGSEFFFINRKKAAIYDTYKFFGEDPSADKKNSCQKIDGNSDLPRVAGAAHFCAGALPPSED